jgi:hypothetical protein
MARRFLIALTLAALCACSRGAEPGNQADTAAADIDVLPPDESASTPTNDLVSGVIDTPPREGAVAPNPQTAIPAAMHGRWGLVPADCTSERGDAKGLITVAADSISFYESMARPRTIRQASPTRIAGEFAFVGEGQNWTSPMIWSVEGGRLVRVDSEPDSRLVYSRCPGGGAGLG